jgi:hypothetical protein
MDNRTLSGTVLVHADFSNLPLNQQYRRWNLGPRCRYTALDHHGVFLGVNLAPTANGGSVYAGRQEQKNAISL